MLAGSLVVVAALGCGDEAEGGSVASGKQVGELSDVETTMVCDELDGYFARFEAAFVAVACTDAARANAATCATERAACIDETPTAGALGDEVELSCSGGPEAITGECAQITVGELSACLKGIIGMVEGLADQYSCTTSPSSLTPAETPTACLDLGSRCPRLAEFSLGD